MMSLLRPYVLLRIILMSTVYPFMATAPNACFAVPEVEISAVLCTLGHIQVEARVINLKDTLKVAGEGSSNLFGKGIPSAAAASTADGRPTGRPATGKATAGKRGGLPGPPQLVGSAKYLSVHHRGPCPRPPIIRYWLEMR
jgi:hypothetical protein